MLNAGDIGTAFFAYSDFSEAKLRPAVVLSNRKFNQETQHVVLAAISSRPPDERFDLQIRGWREAGLRMPSCQLSH